MAQENNPTKPTVQPTEIPTAPNTQKPDRQNADRDPQKDDHKTYGNEPPMIDPLTPEHPGEYEVTAESQERISSKHLLH